jgi:hypothetical protein
MEQPPICRRWKCALSNKFLIDNSHYIYGTAHGEEQPATVQIAAPPCFSPQELLEMRILQDGRLEEGVKRIV